MPNQALDVTRLASLNLSIDAARFLLVKGLDFCGHDEPADSLNRGNFLELLDFISSRYLDGENVMLENARAFTSPRAQKEIIYACATATIEAIVRDIGGKIFCLLIDEACISWAREQLFVVLRYVNDLGVVVQRFLGLIPVVEFTALSLKTGIDGLFSKHGLSISNVRGQGHGEPCSLRDELNELKNLILNEHPSARYVHYYAHPLQSVIVAVSQKSQIVNSFFHYLSMITKTVGASCKIDDELSQKQHESMVVELEKGDFSSVQGSSQEVTRWGSHYTSIVRLLSMWSSVIQVLENISDNGTETRSRSCADSLIEKMERYEFVFAAHLMNRVLGLTNVLSQLLQQKDQNLIEVVSLVKSTKRKLQDLRENGWDELYGLVNDFCAKNDIFILNMEDNVSRRFCPRRDGHAISYYHLFRVEIFCQVIDEVSEELEHRFSESNAELLTCITSLDPKNSFANFNESKLLRLAELHPQDFSVCEQMELKMQLMMWIYEMKGNEKFSGLQDIGVVAKMMVEVGIHTAFHLVYRLIELVLVLPITSAPVERLFSAMDFSMTDLPSNNMGDDLLSDRLVCYIERDVFKSLENEVIVRHFQHLIDHKMDSSLLVCGESKEIQGW